MFKIRIMNVILCKLIVISFINSDATRWYSRWFIEPPNKLIYCIISEIRGLSSTAYSVFFVFNLIKNTISLVMCTPGRIIEQKELHNQALTPTILLKARNPSYNGNIQINSQQKNPIP